MRIYIDKEINVKYVIKKTIGVIVRFGFPLAIGLFWGLTWGRYIWRD